MLSIGWTEMLIVAAIALIVVGPKDLPAMLRQIGKFVGSARRMGNDFKTELNKVAAIDEIRDIKKSFTEPLNETRSKIESEFNSILPDGKVVPSGVIKPADPDSESVVDEIRSAAGMGPSLKDNAQAARDSIASAVTRAAQTKEKTAARTAAKAIGGKAATNKTTTRTSAKAKSAANKSTAKRSANKSTANKSTAKPAAKSAAKPKPAAKPARAAKAKASKPVTAKSVSSKTPPAKPGRAKPVAAKPAARKRPGRKPAKLEAIADVPDDK